MEGYFDEIEQTRAMLDRRYDTFQNGQALPIDGEEALAQLRENSRVRRNNEA